MNARKPIRIVGGGLAGLTLGIGLRHRGVPVTLCEAGHYPRHRVCGEFINGRGIASLQRLGLDSVFRQAGTIEARTAQFYIGQRELPLRELPQPAWCLSRHKLDAALADAFLDSGGNLRTGERVQGSLSAEGTVLATGRQLQPVERGWRWFGLKVHAHDVPLTADLEMHAHENGYIGLCRLAAGEVNVCGVFRRRAAPGQSAVHWREWLRGDPGSTLRARLANARFDEASFCSVAGLALKPRSARHRAACCVGDAITMTPPVTGNGMSMAFESAEIALDPLASYSAGELSWQHAQQQVATRTDRAFRTRLRWARLLHWLMFTRASRHDLATRFLGSQWLWTALYRRTR